MQFESSDWLPMLHTFGDQVLMTKLADAVNHVNDPSKPQLAIFPVNFYAEVGSGKRSIADIFNIPLPAISSTLGASEWSAFYGFTSTDVNTSAFDLLYVNAANKNYLVDSITINDWFDPQRNNPRLFTHIENAPDSVVFNGIILCFTTKP